MTGAAGRAGFFESLLRLYPFDARQDSNVYGTISGARGTQKWRVQLHQCSSNLVFELFSTNIIV